MLMPGPFSALRGGPSGTGSAGITGTVAGAGAAGSAGASALATAGAGAGGAFASVTCTGAAFFALEQASKEHSATDSNHERVSMAEW